MKLLSLLNHDLNYSRIKNINSISIRFREFNILNTEENNITNRNIDGFDDKGGILGESFIFNRQTIKSNYLPASYY